MAKTPRLDPYFRLIYRLYEALHLLEILGRVRGPHQVRRFNFSTLLAVRRRFLQNVAFMCDYTKGGPSSAAVAVEDREECNVFWIASNEEAPEQVRTFLESVLMAARDFHGMRDDDKKTQAEIDLITKCVDFASLRVNKQALGLSSSARRCRECISTQMVDQRDLGEWLHQFEYSNYQNLRIICQSAYEASKGSEMSLLLKLGEEPGNGEAIVPVNIAPLFRKVRHTIGRLAARVRSVKEVIEDSRRLGDVLDVFEVAAVPRPACVPRLPADVHTNLSGILNRMLSPEDIRFPRLLGYLSDLDEQIGLEQAIQDRFDASRSPPCVHAEIQMLHHFHDNGRIFCASDAFIAASKPACFCCKLYFRHHPASYVEPDSHEKVNAGWGPICLPEGRRRRDDPVWIEQRKLLTSVINDVEREILKEIERRRSSPLYRDHPDTQTGLTTSSQQLVDNSSDSQSESWTETDELYESESDPDSEGGCGI